MTRALAAVVASLLIVSCRTPSGASRTKDAASIDSEPTGLALVMSGGFNSCARNKFDKEFSPYGTTLFPRLNELTRTTAGRTKGAVRWIISCFGRRNDQVRWYTASDPKTMKVGTDAEYMAAAQSEIALAGKTRRVVFVGHSWGGSLMMDTVETLARTTHEPDMILFTLDPISRFQCNPSTFFGMLREGVDGHSQVGCRRAPHHLSDEALKSISPATRERWHQFFQDDFRFLHSGPIEFIEEGKNHDVDMHGFTFNPAAPHMELAKRDEVWDAINAPVLAPLEFLEGAPPVVSSAPAFGGANDPATLALDAAVAELEEFFAQTPEGFSEEGFFFEFAGERSGNKSVVVVTVVYRDAQVQRSPKVRAIASERLRNIRFAVESSQKLAGARLRIKDRLDTPQKPAGAINAPALPTEGLLPPSTTVEQAQAASRGTPTFSPPTGGNPTTDTQPPTPAPPTGPEE
jgi:hypothetical protein